MVPGVEEGEECGERAVAVEVEGGRVGSSVVAIGEAIMSARTTSIFPLFPLALLSAVHPLLHPLPSAPTPQGGIPSIILVETRMRSTRRVRERSHNVPWCALSHNIHTCTRECQYSCSTTNPHTQVHAPLVLNVGARVEELADFGDVLFFALVRSLISNISTSQTGDCNAFADDQTLYA